MTLAMVAMSATPLVAADTPGLEATATMNLDIGGGPVAGIDIDSLPIEVADAEIGLDWIASSSVGVHTLFVRQGEALAVEEAWGEWSPAPATLVFGRYTLPHGLYPGRLIHDPLLQQDVESILPGLGVRHDFGAFAASMHLSSRRVEPPPPDTIEPDSPLPSPRQEPVLTPSLQLSFLDEGLVRLSSQLAHHRREMDLASTIPLGTVSLDGEILLADGAEAPADLAFLAGGTWEFLTDLSAAARLDARHSGDVWTRAVATGLIWSFAPGGHCALEWLQDLDGDGFLTFRLGAELGWKAESR